MRPSRLLILSVVVLAFTVPLTVLASVPGHRHSVHHLATAGTQDDIVFGVKGGNLLPWRSVISADGLIVVSGRPARNHQLSESGATLGGLEKLIASEGFWSMPSRTNCPGTLPDVASGYITVHSTSGTRTVTVHGGCVAAFNQLDAVLVNVVGLQY